MEYTKEQWLQHLAEYGTYENRYEDAPITFDPEPDQVILAEYTYENYSGDAWAVWVKDGTVWEQHGGHCSCYGLEDQWGPEELGTPEEAIKVLTKRNSGYSYGLQNAYWISVVDELRKLT